MQNQEALCAEGVVDQAANENDAARVVKRPKLVASYQAALAHRQDLSVRAKCAIQKIRLSYETDETARGREEREELAEETLDYLHDRFDQNGFRNSWSRLVMAHLMLDCLSPIMSRYLETRAHIEKVYALHAEGIPSFLKERLTRLGHKQAEYEKNRRERPLFSRH